VTDTFKLFSLARPMLIKTNLNIKISGITYISHGQTLAHSNKIFSLGQGVMSTLFANAKKYFWLKAYGMWTITLALVLVCACSGPRQPMQEQMLAQVQQESHKNSLQEKLLAQVGRVTLTNYQDYKIGPEDSLAISVFGQDDLSGEVRVNGQGKITMPLVAEVPVAGLTPREVENRLSNLYKEGQYLANPQIKVLVKEYRFQRVVVSGAVSKPGAYELIGPRTLLEVIAQAGGLSERASDVVHVIRSQNAPDPAKTSKDGDRKSFSPGADTIVIDLHRLLVDGATQLNMPLKNGDVIHVPFVENAFVLGAVRKPGNVPVKDKLTIAQAISLAGGLDPQLASNEITVMRFDDQGKRIDLKYNLKSVIHKGEAEASVKQNDIIFVEESGVRRFFYDIKNMVPGQLTIPYGAF
jgi:polysaccharide biosynthesis/export protein